jgi:hypothetical protein
MLFPCEQNKYFNKIRFEFEEICFLFTFNEVAIIQPPVIGFQLLSNGSLVKTFANLYLNIQICCYYQHLFKQLHKVQFLKTNSQKLKATCQPIPTSTLP